MMTIKGKEYKVDEAFLPQVKKFTWNLNQAGYAQTNLSKRQSCKNRAHTMSLHQLVMYLHYDVPLGDDYYIEHNLQIDHINHDNKDNRIANLRFLDSTLNKCRKNKRNTSSKLIGVCKQKKGKWQVNIMIDSKVKYVGSYDDEVEAGKAYDAMVLLHNLQDERILNFPRGDP